MNDFLLTLRYHPENIFQRPFYFYFILTVQKVFWQKAGERNWLVCIGGGRKEGGLRCGALVALGTTPKKKGAGLTCHVFLSRLKNDRRPGPCFGRGHAIYKGNWSEALGSRGVRNRVLHKRLFFPGLCGQQALARSQDRISSRENAHCRSSNHNNYCYKNFRLRQ